MYQLKRILSGGIIILLAACAGSVQKADSERIKASINYLASDELKGRGTATDGEAKAAAYIIDHFKSAGIKPFNGTYEHPFDFNMRVKAGEKNVMVVNGDSLRLFSEFAPVGFSKSGTFSGMAYFAGYGMKITGTNINHYRRLKLDGNAVFVLDGAPASGGNNPHSGGGMRATTRMKASTAVGENAGALIVIVDSIGPHMKSQFTNKDAGLPVFEITVAAFEKTTGISVGTLKTAAENGDSHSIRIPASLALSADIERLSQKPVNVIGELPGKRSDEYIVIGAHYDHLGEGFQGGGFQYRPGVIHNGADDNASGTAGVIELAHMLGNFQPEYTILFMAFSGEELGLLGARAIVSEKKVDPAKIKAMINLDMVGRIDPTEREFTLYGTGTALEFDTLLTQVNMKYNFNIKAVEHSPGNSDHAAFYAENIPVLFFNSGLHDDYHRPSDDSDKINADMQAELMNFISDVVLRLNDGNLSLTFQKKDAPRRERMRFNVYFGTHPDYSYQGKGMKITGTSDGSPAAKSGLQKGDIIKQINDKDIITIYDYMGQLGALKPDVETTLKVERDGKLIELKIIPGKRN